MATYKEIQEYIKDKYGCCVKTCWIAHMKEMCGINVKVANNRIDITKRTHPCPEENQPMIKEAFTHFKML